MLHAYILTVAHGSRFCYTQQPYLHGFLGPARSLSDVAIAQACFSNFVGMQPETSGDQSNHAMFSLFFPSEFTLAGASSKQCQCRSILKKMFPYPTRQ